MLATTVSAIAGGLVAIAKAVPAARAILNQVVAQYYAVEEGRDQTQMNEVDQERDAIVASLKQPGLTDVQKRALYKRLIALSRL